MKIMMIFSLNFELYIVEKYMFTRIMIKARAETLGKARSLSDSRTKNGKKSDAMQQLDHKIRIKIMKMKFQICGAAIWNERRATFW